MLRTGQAAQATSFLGGVPRNWAVWLHPPLRGLFGAPPAPAAHHPDGISARGSLPPGRFKRKAGVFERHLVRIDRCAVRSLHDNGLRYRIRHAAKLAFSLQVLNIGIRSIPIDDLTSLIAQRLGPETRTIDILRRTVAGVL